MSRYQTSLNREELEAGLANATAPEERRRWQVLLHLAAGMPLAEIVALTGYRPRSIRQIVQRYFARGADSLVDHRVFAQGAAPLLSAEVVQELRLALQHEPPDGGEWTGPKVAAWMATRTGRPVYRQRGWEYLQRLRSSQAREGMP
jgi:transposase